MGQGFGNSTPAQNSSASPFGNQQNNSNTAPNTFSFGSANNNQSQTQNQNPAPTFSFGGTSNSTNTNGNQPFSFGNTNNNNGNSNPFQNANNPIGQSSSSASSNIFGQQPTATAGLFGQQGTNTTGTTGLFGQNTASAAQANNGASLFGQSNQAGSMFGQQSQAASTTNLFGQPAKQSNGLFGNAPMTAGTFGQSTSGTNPGNPNGFLGTSTQNSANYQGNSFFNGQASQGQTQQIVPAVQPSLVQSVYGKTSSQPQFSWSRPAQNLSQSIMPSFSMPALTLAQSRFNPTQTLNTNTSTSAQNGYGPSQPASIQEQLLKLKNAWDPTNPDCMFQAYFYNRVAAETASLYTKPDDHKQAAWDTAVANRPDNSVVPVLAKGFTDLQTRLKGQEQQILAYRTRIHEIANKLKELSDRHSLHATPKIDSARRRHIELSRRALQLAAKVQVLKCRGYALRPEEEQLKTRLLSLDKQLHDPRTFGRVDELWAKMTLVKLQQKNMEEQIKSRGYVSTIDFETGESLRNVESVLLDHHNGMDYICRLLKDDLAKVQTQLHKMSSVQGGLDKSKGRA